MKVGTVDGDLVDSVGIDDGDSVGFMDGEADGLPDGRELGDVVGVSVGGQLLMMQNALNSQVHVSDNTS